MLRSLHIENYVLIDSLDVEFPEGLIIITGQTGAGKSILLGALSLLSGVKADAAAISYGAQNCVVEAEFERVSEDLRQVFDENELDWDEGHVIIRRVVSNSGRSRCFVNDVPVTMGVLSQLSASLIDIHSQHQSLLLTNRAFQLSMLDYYCLNSDLLSACRESWSRITSLKNRLVSLSQSFERDSRDREYNETQLSQLNAAKLREGELEELEAESKRLENAQLIKETLESALELMPTSLREASRSLGKIVKYIPAMETLASRIESARIELDDISEELRREDEKVDLSEDRLETISDRLSTLYSLLKKHSCTTLSELVQVRDRYASLLDGTSDAEFQLEQLRKEIADEKAVYDGLCAKLHSSRETGATKFAAKICENLHYLELDRAVFDVRLEDAGPSATGTDSISFLFSASGANLVDAGKCASGGELSRIMLSLKSLMAKFSGMPTMIFDEIDTGVSGSVADKMGSMICQMGVDMQVFAITHLPQVAAKGDAHYVVTKSISDNGKAVSRIAAVEGKDRVEEIARMLSGSSITPQAVANAESLLNGN